MRTVFGPAKYVNKVDVAIGSREPEEQRNSFMRSQLDVSSLFPAQIEDDEPFSRDRLGNTDFPESAVGALSNRYRDTWSTAILILLSKIKPWAAHANALSQLKRNWLVDDAIATLAHDALFSGVGMYWTLRDSALHWQEEHSALKSEKPDVVKAWDMIAAKQVEFEQLRSEQLLGSKVRREAANQVYQAMNTHACQIGAALTLATVFRRARTGNAPVVGLAEAMASGVNEWMLSKTTGDYDRRLVFAKRRDDTPKNPLNMVANMDSPRAVQFRYFWLEILASTQASQALSGLIIEDELKRCRDEARRAYVAYVAGEKKHERSKPRRRVSQRPCAKSRELRTLELRSVRRSLSGLIFRWRRLTVGSKAMFPQSMLNR